MNEINSLNDIRALVAFSTVNGEDAAGLMKFIQSDVRLEKIKENPKRSIFRMTDENGRMLYLKLFGKQKFPFNVIRFYAAKEYRIAKALQKASVPIINYLAWATLKNGGGFCVSEGLPQAVSGRQYFFQTARFDAQKRRVFLERIAELTCALYKRHFVLCLSRGAFSSASLLNIHPIFFLICPPGKHVLSIRGESGK